MRATAAVIRGDPGQMRHEGPGAGAPGGDVALVHLVAHAQRLVITARRSRPPDFRSARAQGAAPPPRQPAEPLDHASRRWRAEAQHLPQAFVDGGMRAVAERAILHHEDRHGRR